MKDKKDSKNPVITMNGKPFEVPPGGTLGVLALGNIGVRAIKAANKLYNESKKEDEKEA